MKSRRCTLSAACVIALIVALLSSCSATNKFEDCVAAGNYADAISVYQEKIYGNTEKEREAQDFLWTYVSSALTDFAEGKMDLTDTKAAFSTVSKINTSSSLAKLRIILLERVSRGEKTVLYALLECGTSYDNDILWDSKTSTGK